MSQGSVLRITSRLSVGELRDAIEGVQDHHHVVIDFHTEYDGRPCTRTGAATSVMSLPGVGEVLITVAEETR